MNKLQITFLVLLFLVHFVVQISLVGWVYIPIFAGSMVLFFLLVWGFEKLGKYGK